MSGLGHGSLIWEGVGLNNDLITKRHSKHWEHVWTGPWCCFSEGVGLTKATVDHPSIVIRAQQTMPSTPTMCGFGHGSVFWRGLVLTKASVDHLSIIIGTQPTMASTTSMCGLGHGSVSWRVWGSLRRV